jgi:hypothetical protein
MADSLEAKRERARVFFKREKAKRVLEAQEAQRLGVPPTPDKPWGARFAAQYGGATAGAMIGYELGKASGHPLGPTIGGGLGAGFGGLIGEEGLNAVEGALGVKDERPVTQRVHDDALAFGSGIGGELLGGIVNKTVSGVTKAALRGGGRKTVDAARQMFDWAGGATPTVGQATNSVAWQTLENAAARFPGPHAPILKKARETIGKMEAQVDSLSSELAMSSDLDRETAGIAIKEGIDTWTERFRRIGAAKYNRLSKLLPPDTPTMASATKSVLQKYVNVNPKAPRVTGQFVSSKLAKTLEGLDLDLVDALARGEGGIPISALQDLRTQVGGRLSEFVLIDDVTRGQVKDLYKAITSDIRSAASTNLGANALPGGLKAFDDANRFWERGIKRIDNFLESLARKGVEPEKLFDAVQRGAEGVTMVRELSKTLSIEERRVVGGAILKRLGTAKTADTADFTASTFLNNWNKKLSAEAKDIFFGKSGQSVFRYNLDQIAAAAERIEKSGQIFANPPNTAQALVGTLSYGAGVGAAAGAVMGFTDPSYLYTLLAASAGGWGGAKFLMTNPKFINWLASGSRVGGGPKAVGNHLGRLGVIAATTEPQTREAIKEYINFYATGVAQDFMTKNFPQPSPVPTGQ